MAELKELGLDKNTIVIFTSDNGPHHEGGADPDFFKSYGPFRGIKRDVYEGGIRIPMVAWCPGTIKAGAQSDHISAFWDVMPTLAELTGTVLPEKTDGISFLPTLLSKKDQQASGKSRALLPPSPLRTVRESFPSYGSSNSIFLFVVRNRLILSTVSFISLVAVVMDKLPYN